MFDGIAHRYDLLNRLLSFGIDQRWRRATAAALNLSAGCRVLDLATGTGDLALAVLEAEPTATVVGLDPSACMLQIARRKAQAAGVVQRAEFVAGAAEQLPFADEAFDAVCIAFGIRNIPDPARALWEMGRVTRDGGRVAVLELSQPNHRLLGALARFHVYTLVPRIGALLSGAREYRYLSHSIAAFPSPDEFTRLMQRCGLVSLELRPLTLGAAHLYVAAPRRPA
jgi:demethylmenaquinone methyltransferase/2-methoxy-6-polyprenyl-1,4-benzoquinol methylase